MVRLAEQDVLQQLSELSSTNKGIFWVAYSGGLDSHVLLTLAQKAIPQTQLRAIHINHGLNPHAEDWQEHCRHTCEQLNVDFESKSVALNNDDSNLELQARQARYAVFETLLKKDDFILMAHHQNDQIETVLYRLLRGSGLKGLAGIPAQRPLGNGRLVRPLLKYSKQAITEYAESSKLKWVEDDSNANIDFDRNYLRQEIVPAIKARWPEAGNSIQRSADLSIESESLLNELAKLDAGNFIGKKQAFLPLAFMQDMNSARQRNILRYWFQTLAKDYNIIQPGFEELRCIVEEVIPAAEDAQPLVSWQSSEHEMQIRRFAKKLYLLKNYPQKLTEEAVVIKLDESAELGANLGRVNLEMVANGGAVFDEDDKLEIRFDCVESAVKPAGRKTRSFKKHYQDYAVPPWMRDRMPLLYINGKLAAVADLFICHDMAAKEGQKQIKINWERSDIYCGY